jgi:hypothetical protein
MQVSEVTVEFLEGVALDGSPPCQMTWGLSLADQTLCGKPSTVRIYKTCVCGHSCHMFLCNGCLNAMYDDSFPTVCSKCGSADFSWARA